MSENTKKKLKIAVVGLVVAIICNMIFDNIIISLILGYVVYYLIKRRKIQEPEYDSGRSYVQPQKVKEVHLSTGLRENTNFTWSQTVYQNKSDYYINEYVGQNCCDVYATIYRNGVYQGQSRYEVMKDTVYIYMGRKYYRILPRD